MKVIKKFKEILTARHIISRWLVKTNKNCVIIFFKQSFKIKGFLRILIIIYNLKAGKCFLIVWSAYSSYIQVVKHYIQYVNCIFIDSETNYLMDYNTNLHSNIKLHNYNL